MNAFNDTRQQPRHLEWFAGESIPEPEAIFYEVLPFSSVWADIILRQLLDLVDLDNTQINIELELAQQVREAFHLILDAARTAKAAVEHSAIERDIKDTTMPWRDRLRNLNPGRLNELSSDKSARIALRWALLETGQGARAGRRWLHYLRDHPAVLRQTVGRALETPVLRGDPGRPQDRFDDVLLVEGVARAYQHLTGKPLGRSVTTESKKGGKAGLPTGPGLWLATFCLKAYADGLRRDVREGVEDGVSDPNDHIDDDRVVRAIRRARRRMDGAAVLIAIADAPSGDLATWAHSLGWALPTGRLDGDRVRRTIKRLTDRGLVAPSGALTYAGRVEAASLRARGASTINL